MLHKKTAPGALICLQTPRVTPLYHRSKFGWDNASLSACPRPGRSAVRSRSSPTVNWFGHSLEDVE